jgi:predicted transcriptional regulator
MRVLWDLGPSPVREVQARLRGGDRNWAYTTTKTILDRLETKGYARRDQTDAAHVYHATVSREEFAGLQVTDLRDEVFAGDGIPLVRALVEGARLTPAEIRELRATLDALDGGDA